MRTILWAPTPHAPPPPVGTNFGVETILPSSAYAGISAVTAELITAGEVTSISVYVSATGGQLALAVYADAAGPKPGARLAYTAPFTPTAGWNTVDVITPASLSAGWYWLAVLAENATVATTYDTASTDPVWFYPHAWGSGVPDATYSAGATGDAGSMSIYATVTPAAEELDFGIADILPSGTYAGNSATAAQLMVPGELVSLSVYVHAAGGGQLALAVYADATGAHPGARLAYTAPFTPTVGWNTVDVITPVDLAMGWYWLGQLAQDTTVATGYGGTAYQTEFYAQAWGSGVPDAAFASGAGTDTGGASMYATVLVDSSGPPPTGAVEFPLLGGILIGGPQSYGNATYRAQIAKLDAAILGMYPLWNGNQFGDPAATPAQTVSAIKALNPSILLGEYTIMTEVNSNTSDTPTAPWRTKLAAEQGPGTPPVGDWYLYNAAGAKVVPYTNTWGTNLSLLTTPDGNGDHWPQWKAKWDNANLIQNGAGVDNGFDIWYQDTNFEDPPVNADWNRDGTNDGTTSSTVKGLWRAGQRAYYDTAKSLQPTKILMLNTDTDLKGDVYPGGLSIPEYTSVAHGALLESLTGQSWSVEVRPPGWAGMMGWYHAVFDNLLDPKMVMFGHNMWEAGDYQTMRYMFASCLMDDGYYCINDAYYHDVLWFDEFDNAGTMTSKWLGAAIDPPQTTAWSLGVYRRRFEGGMALVNPKGNGSRTVTPDSGYRRIAGRVAQETTVNNGAAVTGSVTLADRDGLILVKV